LNSASNDGKVFFIQNRPGLDGRIFSIIKFKTMKDSRDHKGELLPDSDRLTVVGRVVRKLSLDELPQLLNVFLGQMSLVGPRPLLIEYLPLYNDNQRRRHEVSLVSLDGLKLIEEMPLIGRKNLNLIYGMLIIFIYSWN
jgi:undecaprenyl phosphate N,N'-diacetylbacillosamine 1-phosphate transferase